VTYLGFGSISGMIHLIARLPNVAKAVFVAAALIAVCR
jgi:hypothetical protein